MARSMGIDKGRARNHGFCALLFSCALRHRARAPHAWLSRLWRAGTGVPVGGRFAVAAEAPF